MPSFTMPPSHQTEIQYSTNAALERAQSQWLFSRAELMRTPSILDGMTQELESANRAKGVNFITQVGILLKLPQLTLATASVYLHRFFMRHSMVDLPNRPGLHHYSVAATALFLATKVEENCRKMRELVVACCRVAQKQPNLVVDEQSKEYWKWRDTILHNEDLLLEALCFDLQLEQPYKILYDFLCSYRVQENRLLRNTSWAFLNDSHLTTMCLLYSPRSVAASAFYTGTRFADLSFPDDDSGKPWWEQLDLNILEIAQACNLMADVYENSTLPHQNQKEVYVREEGTRSFERTRSTPTPRHEFSPAGSIGAESQGVKRDRDGSIRESSTQNGTSHDRDVPSQPFAERREAPPSPKRQRRESDTSNGPEPQDENRLVLSPGSHEQRLVDHVEVDNVQQKIDDIVNAAGAAENSYPHPPLPRRPSNSQQPQWPGPPPRRRSSSISNRTRPHSAQDGVQLPPHTVEARLPTSTRHSSFERASGGQRGSYDRDNRSVQDYRQDGVPLRGKYDREHRMPQDSSQFEASTLSNADRELTPSHGQEVQKAAPHQTSVGASQWTTEVDDSEKVDYGSEEGEL